jgi:hypothetical protein
VNGFTHPFSSAGAPSAFVTNAALVSAMATAFDAAQDLYVSNAGVGTVATCTSGAGKCSNLLAASVPAHKRREHSGGIALDPSGNLYVGNLSDATVSVFNPPFSAASVPSLIFKVSTGAFAIFGIAVGK